MIRVRCLGHIGSSIGRGEVTLDDVSISAAALVDRLRGMSKEEEPGFNRNNTIALIGDGEAFVPAAADRAIVDGDVVVLIPFSHGG
jgi:molybdopterin converting factor small subunit